MKTWTILEVLNWTKSHFAARSFDNPRLDAEVLIAHALDLQRVMLYARFDQPLKEEERDRIRSLVKRRSAGEPVAYLVGEKEFWSLPFEVTRDVLIPRPDSETVVELGADLLRGKEAPVIADVGTGSGCLAVALAHQIPDARVYALEISAAAVAVATRNAERNGVADRVQVIESDLLAGLPADVRVDLLVANLPYVPSGRMETLMKDVRDFEPRLALDGGDDGLDPIRRLVQGLGARMAPGASVALEADPEQMPAIVALLTEAGFESAASTPDLAGRKRVATARWVDGAVTDRVGEAR